MQVVQMRSESADLVIEFEDFWSLYPRRVAKKEARTAWNKIDAKLHTQIMTALFEWARIWGARGEIQYVPYPATWLNGDRWEDDFPPGHKPYSMKQQREQCASEESGERKTMPQHVIDAIKRMRS